MVRCLSPSGSGDSPRPCLMKVRHALRSRQEEPMAYRIAGIDVHKKKLAVVVTDVEVEDEYQFERRWYGSQPAQLRALAEWLIEQQVEEVVIESTAQYWKPVPCTSMRRIGF